jgi:hypothetical protein
MAQMPFSYGGSLVAVSFNARAMVISLWGRPPLESGKSTRRLSLHIPERIGSLPVSNPARLGVQTGAAT